MRCDVVCRDDSVQSLSVKTSVALGPLYAFAERQDAEDMPLEDVLAVLTDEDIDAFGLSPAIGRKVKKGVKEYVGGVSESPVSEVLCRVVSCRVVCMCGTRDDDVGVVRRSEERHRGWLEQCEHRRWESTQWRVWCTEAGRRGCTRCRRAVSRTRRRCAR